MARANAHIGSDTYVTAITTGHHKLTADEPASRGGSDAGPAPFDLLLAALGACTAMTLRMYADHKGSRIDGLDVALRFTGSPDGDRVDRVLTVTGLDDTQRQKLADIAERTPVTLALKYGVAIHTTLA